MKQSTCVTVRSLLANLVAGVAALSLAACASQSRVADDDGREAGVDPRSHDIYNGHTAQPMTWDAFIAFAEDAHVIVIGEQHDDAAGHDVQQAVVEDLFEEDGDGSVLSMEMLDRSEQAIADDYTAGLIDRERFIQETANTRWRSLAKEFFAGEIDRGEFEERILRPGWPDWETNYQPIIDAAKERGGRILAANTPWMRYTDRIDLESGYTKLETLTPAQRELVAWPDAAPTGQYRERFWEFMVQRKEGEEPDPPEEDADDATESAEANPHVMNLTDEQVLEGFMKQFLYDATMADSIARALSEGATRVVHLVGQFHSDFEGGTVLELRRRSPGARILTVSLQPVDAARLREEDRGRADIVIYTR